MNINGTGLIIGPYLADFMRAGAEFESTTLTRFYSLHMLLIPGAIIALIGAHLYLVVKLGTTAPPWIHAETKPKSIRTEKVAGEQRREGVLPPRIRGPEEEGQAVLPVRGLQGPRRCS